MRIAHGRQGTRHSVRRVLASATLLCLAIAAGPASAEDAVAEEEDLGMLDIEDLLDLEITSVSKSAQALLAAAASISVVTNEEIRRSGATSIPEALRNVPGLHVARVNANRWAVSARGFNNAFANKLLVLIDGRSVYSSLFGGVYWDTLNVRMDDIDRIEVIRGPGGTVWGANAVNGVINVITKRADRTHGLAAEAGYGNFEPGGNVRYGGRIGDAHYRTYVNGFQRGDFDLEGGGGAADGYSMVQGGFRADWDLDDRHSLTFQGDGYGGADDEDDAFEAAGGNVLTRWRFQQSELSSTQLQVYWDYAFRSEVTSERRHTADVEFQHDFSQLDPVTLSWGANLRMSTDENRNVTATALGKTRDTHWIAGGFVQAQWEIVEDVLVATAGTKLDWNNYTGVEYQPSGRLRWSPAEGHTVWGAISRAVRTPTRIDRDLDFMLGPVQITGNEDIESEELLAFELGYRIMPIPEVSVELSGFYFLFEKLRAVSERNNAFDLTFENNIASNAYGVEVETTWQALDSLRLITGYAWFDASSRNTGQVSLEDFPEDSNPAHQVSARALLDLPYRVEFDGSVAWVSSFPGANNFASPPVDAYLRLDLRLGWRPTDHWELSISGENLTDSGHVEYTDPQKLGTIVEVPRSVFAKTIFRY